MSPYGRPKGEFRSAQHGGCLVSAPGRLRPDAAVLRQAKNRPQDGFTSGLSPKGELRSAQHEGTPVSAHGRSKALIPQRAARRVVQ